MTIRVHGLKKASPERDAGERFARAAASALPALEDATNIVLEIFPSVQCFGQRVQDIDLLICFANYGKDAIEVDGFIVHSFCLVVEIKGHRPSDVTFEGNRCIVEYNYQKHDVTNQSEAQKYSLKKYIEQNIKHKARAPYIVNVIWLTNVPASQIPKNDNNIWGSDVTWSQVLKTVTLLAGKDKQIACFSSRPYLSNVIDVFSHELSASKIDRKRLEAITKSVLDRTQQIYAQKLGKQLLIFRGRGGTGKTVRLIRIAYQAYNDYGLRVALLTYNKALVADLRRLLALLHVKDSAGEGSVAIMTIHKFVYEWLLSLGLIHKGENTFLSKYEELKLQALELLDAAEPCDIEDFRTQNSKSLSWDLLLIDESQDWPSTERDLLYRLYGFESVVIADGVDQLVRGVEKVDWRENVPTSKSQIVPLRQSLRLKASLCTAVGHFAEEIEYSQWNLQPLPESYGGRVIVVTGDPLSEKFHRKLSATARHDGNMPIDMLFCVPPSWVESVEDESTGELHRRSRIGKQYEAWGMRCWDAVDPEARDAYPTSLDEYRVVQYESCRGLEGWVVVNFALDEFFEDKRCHAEFTDAERDDMYFDRDAAALDYARRWVMIPLTRAIDTLVIHVNDKESYVGKVVMDLLRRDPENVEHYDFSSD